MRGQPRPRGQGAGTASPSGSGRGAAAGLDTALRCVPYLRAVVGGVGTGRTGPTGGRDRLFDRPATTVPAGSDVVGFEAGTRLALDEPDPVVGIRRLLVRPIDQVEVRGLDVGGLTRGTRDDEERVEAVVQLEVDTVGDIVLVVVTVREAVALVGGFGGRRRPGPGRPGRRRLAGRRVGRGRRGRGLGRGRRVGAGGRLGRRSRSLRRGGGRFLRHRDRRGGEADQRAREHYPRDTTQGSFQGFFSPF